jgi:hypothetical protein
MESLPSAVTALDSQRGCAVLTDTRRQEAEFAAMHESRAAGSGNRIYCVPKFVAQREVAAAYACADAYFTGARLSELKPRHVVVCRLRICVFFEMNEVSRGKLRLRTAAAIDTTVGK